MSLLQDLLNGKELALSDGGKLTVVYQTDANVLAISIGGNQVILSQNDLDKLVRIESLLRQVKQIESLI